MGAAEARALWQKRAGSRRFSVHEDAKMAPRLLASCHRQRSSSSGSNQKSSFSSKSYRDSSCDAKWWLKGSSGSDDEIANTFYEDDTKCKKLHEFVDLIGIREQDEVDYCFITTPWWRSTTDKDELALFVATRSVDYNIQKCDLTPPQQLHKRIHCTSGEKGSSPRSDDLSKAQILEALMHSQTGAREAEKAARDACAEKERVLTIFLKQASQFVDLQAMGKAS